MMKLCFVSNSAAHYRAAIFKKIDETFDCDWYFGPAYGNIKQLDITSLKGKTALQKKRHLGPFDYQTGVIPLLWRKEYNVYLVFANTKTLSTWIFALLSKLCPKKKVYFWSHGFYGKETKMEARIKKFLFKLPNGGTFVYGNHSRDLMIKAGVKPDKVFTLHNSLAYDQQVEIRKTLSKEPIYTEHFGNDNPNLFFVGRLTPIKQLDMVLDAIALCNSKGKNYNMTFIGGGEEMDNLKRKADELNISEQVWFYGPCYDEKVLSSLIYNADLCVAPGNIGLTAMHSMVFGTPCITHDDFPYQMPEFEAIIPHKTGCFFKRNSVEDLAAKIDEWFINDGKERATVRENCMKEIDSSWNPYFQIEVFKNNMKP